jgi:hypothetical protein
LADIIRRAKHVKIETQKGIVVVKRGKVVGLRKGREGVAGLALRE